MTQVHFYNQSCVHVDGYKSIISFNKNQILLRCKKNVLAINGSQLQIYSFNGTEITVQGHIESVCWQTEGVRT
ncbi:MAG: YabP/YqfC family sporulation protein [Wujia sp.]